MTVMKNLPFSRDATNILRRFREGSLKDLLQMRKGCLIQIHDFVATFMCQGKQKGKVWLSFGWPG